MTGTASDTTLLVIAKQPVPGRVKTRLVPPCSYQQAAALAEAAIQRARLLTAGMRVADLPTLRDVDTAADALAVASQAPRTRFAARVRKLTPVLRPVPVAGPGAIGETA